jgi:hypothetical protein
VITWSSRSHLRAATMARRIGAFFDSESGRYEPSRGDRNGERLPAFFAGGAFGVHALLNSAELSFN